MSRSPLQEIPVKDIAYEIEDAFLERIRALIYRDLSDSNLDVSYLTKKMAMSRSQLFRKIKALTGESPSVFIRTIRLHHAKKLLETTHLNVSEIAYDVGFSNPAYFAKLFRERFGVPPGIFREKWEGL